MKTLPPSCKSLEKNLDIVSDSISLISSMTNMCINISTNTFKLFNAENVFKYCEIRMSKNLVLRTLYQVGSNKA